MKYLSPRALKRINCVSLLGVCGFTIPLGHFGEWAIALSWLVCLYLWIETDVYLSSHK
jgi:hypothetical protein